ncbi:MAG: hypothetical protein RLZZ225_38 [Pseudomonadota bacterium]|jgi:hypothetical protein
MQLNHLASQKGARKVLIDLLHKKSYCICIPEPELVELYFNQVSPRWIQDFLLTKNTLGYSVIPMFMFIFVKNKHLDSLQSLRLQRLLYLLIAQVNISVSVDQILLENKNNKAAWIYYVLYELMQFNLSDFLESSDKRIKILSLVECIEFFLEKSSAEALTRLCLNTDKKGYHIIQKAMYLIANEALHPLQRVYLTNITEKLIQKTIPMAIESRIFQIQQQGFSFIWCTLCVWLQLVFTDGVFNHAKIDNFTRLINGLLDKVRSESLMQILLERNGIGYVLILFHILFRQSKLSDFNQESINSLNPIFNRWLKKIFANITITIIESMLEHLPNLLLKDTRLSKATRQKLMTGFFDYLVQFSRLKSDDLLYLDRLKERLEDQFLSGNKVVKLFQWVQTCCNLFKPCVSLSGCTSKSSELDASQDETYALMNNSGRVQLNYRYSTISS